MPSPEKISGYQLAEHLLAEGGVEALLRYAGNAETDWLELKAGMCLLPEDRKKGKITVYIEAREPYSKEENFVFLRDACRFSLARDFPARAEKISLEIRKMRKGSPYNAYTDFVANTCFARLESVAQRLAKPTAKADKYYGTLLKEDVTDPAVYMKKVDSVIAQLPTLGADRIAALREQTTNPQSGLRLAAMVLPFNFR